MPLELKLPDIGEGVVEGEILKWFVKEGDEVKEDQPLVEVMTDKVNVEIPSPRMGTVLRILANEGQVVKVGEPIIVIGGKDEKPAMLISPPVTTPMPTTPAAAGPPEPQQGVAAASREVLATPATRRLARELGVDLLHVSGTGPAGRITEEDVRKYVAAGTKPTTAAPPRISVSLLEERMPLRGLRRKIAEKMVRSRQIVAQVTHVDDVDVTELVALRERLKATADAQGVHLTYLPFFVKAVVRALKEFPFLNASVDDERGEIVLKKYYNIGIATAVEEGLIVPVVKNADRKDVYALAREIEALGIKAREGRLALEEVRDGTFTITNVGPIGGLMATPIINHPEVAILGTHKIVKKPVYKDENIRIRDMMFVSLSFDHRVIDGAVAARFVNSLVTYLEHPLDLLV